MTHCNEQMVGIEYPYNHPGCYDGISEWVCERCSIRIGRWSGKILLEGDYERPRGRTPRQEST
jgi:hypothetical protein